MPSYSWLAKNVASQWGINFGKIRDALLVKRDDPFVRRHWPGDVYDRAFALWEDRPALLDAIDRVPKVRGHGDYQPGNLFSRRRSDGQAATVVIDWSMVGLAPVGRDLTNLFGLAAVYFGMEPSWLASSEALIYAAYFQGLHDAGWHGDDRVVRFAHTAALGMFGGLHPAAVEPVGDEQRAVIESFFGLPVELVLERNAQLRRFCLDLADEARELLHFI